MTIQDTQNYRQKEDFMMPMVVKKKPTNAMYGSFKTSEAQDKFMSSFGKKKESIGYNAHQVPKKN